MPNVVILATGDFFKLSYFSRISSFKIGRFKRDNAYFHNPVFYCSIVPRKNADRDDKIKKMLERNGAGPGHQLTPQELPGSEIVTINPNNGKDKDMEYIYMI